ncbi:MAG: Gfo/Idh/MocA family protein [Chloroflexota bacterium]
MYTQPAIGVAIIGTGGIARAHARACREVEGVELVAICDVSPEALARFGDEWHVPASNRYPSVEALTEAIAPDIAIISTWGISHATMGIHLAQSKRVRAILCEKPFTMDAREAVALVDACQASGTLIAEAFKFRHHPVHLEIRRRIDAGIIGEIVSVRSAFCQSVGAANRRPEANWRWDRARGGGSVYDLACYNIHHARHVFGCEPTSVYASGQFEGEIDVASSIVLTFPGERTAVISVAHNTWRAHDVEIGGTHGQLRLENPWNNEDQSVTLVQVTAEGTQSTVFEPVYQFGEQLRHLADCVRTGAPHRIPPDDSISQMQTIDAVFRSLRSGEAAHLGGDGPAQGSKVP